MLTIQECNKLCGRVIARMGQPYTITSATTEEEIHVWDPRTEELLIFDSRETFENWAYGTPVSAASPGGREEPTR